MIGRPGSIDKPKNFKGSLIKLFSYLKPYKLKVLIVLIFAIGSTIFSIISPKILGKATTKLFEGIIAKKINQSYTIDLEFIKNILLLLIVLYAISSILNYIQRFIMVNISEKITFKLREDISKKINRLPLKYFDSNAQGDILSRVTNDIDTLNQTISNSVSEIVTSITLLLGILTMMFSINFYMTLIALLTVPVAGILIAIIVKRSQKYFTLQQKHIGNLNGYIEEIYSSFNVVKAFNGEENAYKQFQELNNELHHSSKKSQLYSGIIMPAINIVSDFGYVLVCVVGGYFTVKKRISVGDIQAFIQYMRNLNQPLRQTAGLMSTLQSAAAASERVFEFLESEEEIKDKDKLKVLKSVTGNVEFDNVTFGYDKDKQIIKDFNCKIKSGETVAIVGPTGAGKTTLVNLLMRFYEIENGSIKVDGVDIRDISKNNLRNIFGMVLQDTWIFNGTIRENIKYGNFKASDRKFKEACKASYVEEFINTLPDGYDLVLNEESSNISGGQKQLITIARALLANPDILILDEATSSVDTRTEVLIQNAMENLMKNRTSFIIAHRLSTIKNADLIIVMNEGKILEQGNHKELIKKKGFYADLYNSQFETTLPVEISKKEIQVNVS